MFYWSKNPDKNVSLLKKNKKTLSCTTVFNIKKKKIKKEVNWAPNQLIGMISEESCDTEDWSKGCWKFSFAIPGINVIFKIYYNRKLLF